MGISGMDEGHAQGDMVAGKASRGDEIGIDIYRT